MKISTFLQPSRHFSSILQLSFLLALILAINLQVSWIWWAASVFFCLIVYLMIGNSIALHRFFTHQHFTVAKPIEWFFVWVSSMIGMGSPLSYAIMHETHHQHSDNPNIDPHGPHRGIKSIFMLFQKEISHPIFNKRIAVLAKKWGWVHKFYVPFVLINSIILFAINFKVFLFLWWLPATATLWLIGGGVLLQHWGNRPRNYLLIDKIFIGYEGLHENHHKYPNLSNTALKAGEIDYTYKLSKIFRPKYKF